MSENTQATRVDEEKIKQFRITAIQLGVGLSILILSFLFGHLGVLHNYIPYGGTGAVKIRLHGPVDVFVGREYVYYIEIDGKHGKPMWQIVPETPGILTLSTDGLKAHFNSDKSGIYTLTVSVSGEGMSVDTKHIEIDNMLVMDSGGGQQQPPPQQPCPVPQPNTPPVSPPVQPSDNGLVTVQSIVWQALSNVSTDDAAKSVVEAQKVAGCVNMLIEKIKRGNVDTSDSVNEILVPCVKQALGERADGWAVFLVEVGGILDEMRMQGSITDAASTVPVLNDIAFALLKARKEHFSPQSFSQTGKEA